MKLRASGKTNLYIRILAGGYVAYQGYLVFKDRANITSSYYVIMGFAILFMILGTFLVAVSVKMLIKKEYDDAEKDEGAENAESKPSETGVDMTSSETESIPTSEESESIPASEEEDDKEIMDEKKGQEGD